MRQALLKISALTTLVLLLPVLSSGLSSPGTAGEQEEHARSPERAPDQAEDRVAGEMPLSKQLEGLGPAPRLAYLRHLLTQGRADADVMFQTAVAYHELDQPDSALHYYDRAIAIDPQDFKSHVNKGVLYDDRGDYARAIKSFATAVTINPEDALAHSHLAFLLHQNGDHRAAWDHLHEALEIDPRNPQPHFYLAVFFWESRIYREAIREWETVMDLDPDGFLAAKARENIVMLQEAIETDSPEGGWRPER